MEINQKHPYPPPNQDPKDDQGSLRNKAELCTDILRLKYTVNFINISELKTKSQELPIHQGNSKEMRAFELIRKDNRGYEKG